MIPLWPAITVLAVAWTALTTLDRWRRNRRRDRIGRHWGHPPPDRSPQASVTRTLFDLEGPEHGAASLDERTWIDLDLDTLHRRMDHTLSPIGTQALYRLLRSPIDDCDRLKARRHRLVTLDEDADTRIEVQQALADLGDDGVGHLVEALWADPPPPSPLDPLVPILSVVPAIAIVLALLEILPWFVVVVCLFGNIVVHFAHYRRLESFPLIHLGSLLTAAAALKAASGDAFPETCRGLEAGLRVSATARRRLSVLFFDDGLGLVRYVRVLFLLDVGAWTAAARLVRRAPSELRQLLVTVGDVDALIGLASWCRGQQHLRPCEWGTTIAGSVVEGLRHPLLHDPVPATIHLDGRSLLVTGSNMSGKTTFLKAIGVNAVLAQTIGSAMADRWTLPPVRIVTSIGRADNLIEGRSYYLAEVESIGRMVEAAGRESCHIFLADEIFRGTNAVERIAAGVAVLRHLASGRHLVVAATHDLELADLLGDKYLPVHFGETLDAGGLRFDYRLHPGVTTGRTALDLLERTGYPEAIVAAARALRSDLE